MPYRFPRATQHSRPGVAAQPLAILDISRRGIPSCDASLFIQHRFKAEKKPAILPVSSSEPHFELVRGSTSEFAGMFAYHAFRILWMKQPMQISTLPLLKSKAVIIKRGLVVIERTSIGPKFGNVLR